MTTRALVLGGGGVAGISWEVGLLVGLAEVGVDVRNADLIVGTSAGSVAAAQVGSGLTWEELFQRQIDPALQAKELPANLSNIQQLLEDLARNTKEGDGPREFMQKMGASALKTSTVSEAERRQVIVSRLPVKSWPERRLEIVAINAYSGERVAFTRESGVELVDAVAASCAVPGIWPPVTIKEALIPPANDALASSSAQAGGKEARYIDGGCYSVANADLAAGFDKVLIVQPGVPDMPLPESLDEQVERLRREGSQVEVIMAGQAMIEALVSVGGNVLDPSLRATAANIGREQGRDEAGRLATWW